MRMKRFARVFTTSMLAGAMVMTMGGMTAFAAVDSIPLTKTVTTDGNTYAPDVSFGFTIGNGSAGTLGDENAPLLENDDAVPAEALGAVVYSGSEADGALSIENPDFEFKPGDTVAASYSKTSTIKVDSTRFTKPGIYHYTISENIPEENDRYDGIVYDEKTRDVYVYVVSDEDGNLTVSNVIVAIEGEKQGENVGVGESGIEFVNNYGKDKDDDDNHIEEGDTTHDLTVTKTVAGNQGNRKTPFTFKVSVRAAVETERYKLVLIDENGSEITENRPEDVPNFLVGNGVEVSIPLKDKQSFRIYGLSENDLCSVKEEDYTSDGYTTTYAYGGVPKDEALNEYKVTADESVFDVTNTKSVTTPTGIVLSFAPYIMLVALAGVFAVLFLRKKKEEF